MAIVSGSLPKLYISDGSETHSFKFISYSLGQENTFSSYSNSKLTTTPNRAMSSYVSGETPVSLELETYFHYFDNGGLISASEKLLWESLSATTSQEFLANYKVTFSDSSTNKLRELTVWLEFDTGIVWEISNVVVEAISANLSISTIGSAKWKMSGLTIDIDSTIPETFEDRSSTVFYKNKLDLVNLTQLGTSYNLPIIDGNIEIINTVQYVQRKVLGELSAPQEHYVTDRRVFGSIKTYMNTGTGNSIDLYDNMKTISDKDIGYNLRIALNGCSNIGSTSVDFYINNALLTFPGISLSEKPLTMDFSFIGREMLLGDNTDVNVTYEYYIESVAESAEINDN